MDERQAQLEAQLSAYLDDELTPEQRAKVEAFLAQDAGARALLAELRMIAGSLRSLPRARAKADLLEGVQARLERRELLGETDARPVMTTRGLSFTGRWVAAAAIVLMTGVAGFITWNLNRAEKHPAQQLAAGDRPKPAVTTPKVSDKFFVDRLGGRGGEDYDAKEREAKESPQVVADAGHSRGINLNVGRDARTFTPAAPAAAVSKDAKQDVLRGGRTLASEPALASKMPGTPSSGEPTAAPLSTLAGKLPVAPSLATPPVAPSSAGSGTPSSALAERLPAAPSSALAGKLPVAPSNLPVAPSSGGRMTLSLDGAVTQSFGGVMADQHTTVAPRGAGQATGLQTDKVTASARRSLEEDLGTKTLAGVAQSAETRAAAAQAAAPGAGKAAGAGQEGVAYAGSTRAKQAFDSSWSMKEPRPAQPGDTSALYGGMAGRRPSAQKPGASKVVLVVPCRDNASRQALLNDLAKNQRVVRLMWEGLAGAPTSRAIRASDAAAKSETIAARDRYDRRGRGQVGADGLGISKPQGAEELGQASKPKLEEAAASRPAFFGSINDGEKMANEESVTDVDVVVANEQARDDLVHELGRHLVAKGRSLAPASQPAKQQLAAKQKAGVRDGSFNDEVASRKGKEELDWDADGDGIKNSCSYGYQVPLTSKPAQAPSAEAAARPDRHLDKGGQATTYYTVETGGNNHAATFEAYDDSLYAQHEPQASSAPALRANVPAEVSALGRIPDSQPSQANQPAGTAPAAAAGQGAVARARQSTQLGARLSPADNFAGGSTALGDDATGVRFLRLHIRIAEPVAPQPVVATPATSPSNEATTGVRPQ